MTNKTTIIISLLSAVCALPAAAQVSKEITVEREVVATLREVSPMTFTPSVALPAVEKPTLTYSERTITAHIPALFGLLEPAAVADSIAASPWRGYAALGYFPAFNLGASAGYRIIDTRRTALDAWMQYDGNSYNVDRGILTDHDLPEDASRSVKSQNVALGFRLGQAIGRHGHLGLGLSYALDHFNNPFAPTIVGAPHNQSLHRVDADAIFSSRTNDLGYSLGLDYNLFSFANGFDQRYDEINPVRENRVGLKGALFADIDEKSSYRLDIDASMLSMSQAAAPPMIWTTSGSALDYLTKRDGKTSGLVTITPAYRYGAEHFRVKIGARLDLSFNDGKFFHIAPDVKAVWTPSGFFALYGRAGGGEHQNTMGSLYAVDRFIAPSFFYSNSHVPIEAEAGLRVGPFRGASLNLSAHYAVANDWLMPFAKSTGYVLFGATDVRGWQFQAVASYSYRNMATLSVKGILSPVAEKKVTRCYYTNLDHARYVLDTELTLHPMEQLDILVGYELRASRSMRWHEEGEMFDYDVWIPGAYDYKIRMKNLANLRVGASWRFTPAFTLFGRVENILNRTTSSFSLIPSQGVKGLIGVAYKF